MRQTNSTLLPLQHQRKLNQHLNSCQNSPDYILSGFHPHTDYKEREKCPLSITRNQLNEVHNVLSLILRIVTKSESKSPSPAQPCTSPLLNSHSHQYSVKSVSVPRYTMLQCQCSVQCNVIAVIITPNCHVGSRHWILMGKNLPSVGHGSGGYSGEWGHCNLILHTSI